MTILSRASEIRMPNKYNFSPEIDENDPTICFSIKVSVADLDFWLKLVGPAAAMVKKGPCYMAIAPCSKSPKKTARGGEGGSTRQEKKHLSPELRLKFTQP